MSEQNHEPFFNLKKKDAEAVAGDIYDVVSRKEINDVVVSRKADKAVNWELTKLKHLSRKNLKHNLMDYEKAKTEAYQKGQAKCNRG